MADLFGWIDWSLIGFILIAFVAAMSGAGFKPGAWYAGLAKPSWNPPNWLFPIAWSVLYAMIAVSGWSAYQAAGGFAAAPVAFGAYFAQLFFNFGWSAVFFGMKRPDLGLIEVGLLWFSILINMMLFTAIDPSAGWLLLPYFLWVSFAARLNHEIWRINPAESADFAPWRRPARAAAA